MRLKTAENIQEIKSLINLMDDPDPFIYSLVSSEILKRGGCFIPWLEESLLTTENPLLVERIANLVHSLQLQKTQQNLSTWVDSGQNNLLMGALIIAQYQYPGLKGEQVIKRLGQITQDIYLKITPEMSPIEKTKIINTVLFNEYEFYGNKRDYQSPQCSYLNVVFETGRGNHLSLGIVYILVAQSLGIPITGVDLEDYFFLGYLEGGKMLFYINPFSKGNTLTRNELTFFLKLAEVDLPVADIEPASNLIILRRMVTNLVESYRKAGDSEKALEMNEMLKILLL